MTTYFLLTAMALVGISKEATAKCAAYWVVVAGDVHSAAKEQTIVVRVHMNKGNKSLELRAAPVNGHFRVSVPFDTLVSASMFGGHNCSRRPTTVEVILFIDGSPKQTVQLSFENDFTLDSQTAEWRAKVPVVLVPSA